MPHLPSAFIKVKNKLGHQSSTEDLIRWFEDNYILGRKRKTRQNGVLIGDLNSIIFSRTVVCFWNKKQCAKNVKWHIEARLQTMVISGWWFTCWRFPSSSRTPKRTKNTESIYISLYFEENFDRNRSKQTNRGMNELKFLF